MTVVSGFYIGPRPSVGTDHVAMVLHYGKGDANSPFSLQWWMSSLLAPSNQMSSLEEESTSPKILPCSQDFEAPSLKREEKERRILFFFLNILGRNERGCGRVNSSHLRFKTVHFVKGIRRAEQHIPPMPSTKLILFVPSVHSTEASRISVCARCLDQCQGYQDKRQNLGYRKFTLQC